MNNDTVKLLSALLLSTSLVACGGGGGGGGGSSQTPEEIQDSYETLDSAGSKSVKGSQWEVTSTVGTGRSSGTYNGSNDTLNVNGLVDIERGALDVGYDYATTYIGETPGGGSVVGVTGIATDASDMPSSGTKVTYSGDSLIALGDDYNAVTLNGDSLTTVNFSSGEVDVVMDNFASSQVYGYNSDMADTVTIEGATISGNEFSGGDVTATKNGSTVYTNRFVGSTDVTGNFYGYDADLEAPDEVGGSFGGTSLNDYIFGTFIGD